MDAIKTILLVEDSPGDVRLTQEAFRAAGGALRLYVAIDGAEAISFLRRKGAYGGAPRPDMILLDLNMPGLDGRQVLAIIKQDEDLKTIPIVILTTSDVRADIDTVYHLRANCYLTKPVEFDAFENLVKKINEFWLTIVRLPPKLRTQCE